ncbi:DHA2 family efflux MFS transporter permease subunit [Deminuibacter soli]|uniref:MFS transporter n=1 Tax=Deminuibacter soli TaxID=2291815 RepID=A0A3E1NEW1_9BACT|nr:DHA2 family efflux MFS transporter permease subunit [Deminuibacter soli]RFM26341.1 MFS transporter [Deminuibacter soli]
MSVKGFARAIIVVTTVTAAIMELIDTSIVNVAISDMAGGLGVSIDDISWVITSYGIANVIIIPLTGFMAELFGRKNYYIASMILFTVTSYMCAQSTGLVEIIIWRFMQGLGGGALLSTSQGILFDAFEPEERPIASGLFGMGVVLGPTLGPTLGGYLIEHSSWPSIFLINIPIGIIATILAYAYVPKKPNEGKNRKNVHIDYTGILLLMAGIGCLQYVLERGETEDWFASTNIRICSAIAVVGVILFILWELKQKNPAVKISVLGNRNLATTATFTFIAGIGLNTSVFVYPLLAQRVLGFTAYETGVSLLPPSLITIVLMPVMGKILAKGVSPIPFVVIGFLMFGLYQYQSSLVSPDVGKWDFFIPLCIRSIGISCMMLPLTNQAVAGLQPKDYGSGIALNNMLRQLGGAVGIALANIYVRQQYFQHRNDLVGAVPANSTKLIDQVNTLSKGLAAKTGDLVTATHQAYGIIDAKIETQSYYLAYMDTFRLIAIFFIAALPFVFLLKVKKKSKAELAAEKEAMAEAH